MSKAVLISIRPEWVNRIVSGEKTVEIRKNRPNLKTPYKCYIYFDVSDEDIIAKEIIRNAPTVDAVPVVRCQDCKHLHMWDQKDRYAFCPKTNILFSPFEKDIRTFFCSYGERRKSNENHT